MSKSNQFETDLLNLIFLNTDITLIGDAAGLQNSAAAGNLYISLHTADPGEAGAQNTSESAYTNYARQPVARTAGGSTVQGALTTPPIPVFVIEPVDDWHGPTAEEIQRQTYYKPETIANPIHDAGWNGPHAEEVC